jgi:hypothetical protein
MFGLVWFIANIWRSFTKGDTFVIPDYFLPYFSHRSKISVFIAEFLAQYVVFVSSSLLFKPDFFRLKLFVFYFIPKMILNVLSNMTSVIVHLFRYFYC